VALCGDGRRIASASRDGTVRLWDIDTGDELQTFQGNEGGATCVALSADDGRIASGSSDGKIRVWDVGTGEALQTFTGHAKPVETVAFCDDRWIGSAGDDETVIIWDSTTGEIWCKLCGHVDTVKSITFCAPLMGAERPVESRTSVVIDSKYGGESSWAGSVGVEYGLGRANTNWR